MGFASTIAPLWLYGICPPFFATQEHFPDSKHPPLQSQPLGDISWHQAGYIM
uniref:Uncharacterized protein n=1 Tax=Rhizophora mucronata TaxID=61149 RepID=A0A2P2PWA0_RHIMU